MLVMMSAIKQQQPGSDKTRDTPRYLSLHTILLKEGRVPAAPDLIRPGSRWAWIDGSNFEPQVYSFDESSSGIKVQTLTADSRECEFFNYFWEEDILETIVTESNRYLYFMRGGRALSPESREHQWHDVTVPEMKFFFGPDDADGSGQEK